MNLYVLRHAESLTNTKDILDDNSLKSEDKNELSEKGKKQAEELVKNLEKLKLDIIILSPLIRTKETIEPYIKLHPTKVIVSKLVIERNGGVFGGKTRSSIREYCEAHNLNRVTFRPENGESIIDMYNRAKKFLTYLKDNFIDKNVLVCTHSRFIQSLDIAIKGEDIMNFYNTKEIENVKIIKYHITK